VRGGLLVCGTTSDAGKSFVVAGLCRLLARRGVRVAPFKAQNMANNASVTADGAEIAHAQWVQALAAGAPPEAAMNPVLLKPTTERASQVVVLGKPVGTWPAATYHGRKGSLLPVVLEALDDLRSRYEVVVCEGAGSPAEINLLDGDIANLRLAREAGLAAVVVGDIDRGGVFAALYGTVALLPDDLRPLVRGFILNKFRGDRELLGDATAELERRCGVPTLGCLPMLRGADLDAEDSLTLDGVRGAGAVAPRAGPADDGPTLDVAAVRFPRVANFGDLDPLRLEPGVRVRWVRAPAELGRPHLVVLPGSKSTRSDLGWLRATGLAGAVESCGAPVIGICAGLQMMGRTIDDPRGVEGEPGRADGLGWLPVNTRFEGDKVLDRPSGRAVGGPGKGEAVAGFRIHHGRVTADSLAPRWLEADGGSILGWHDEGRAVAGTTLHALFEADRFRAAVLRWAAAEAGVPEPPGMGARSFAAARLARLDRIADAIERNVDVERLFGLVESGGARR
jgi:adenosylcobyric acid synthase